MTWTPFDDLNREVAQRLSPLEEEIALLDTIPGVGRETPITRALLNMKSSEAG